MGLGGGVKTSTISKLLERGRLAYFELPRFCPRQGKITETFNKLSKQAKKIKNRSNQSSHCHFCLFTMLSSKYNVNISRNCTVKCLFLLLFGE